MIATAVSPAQTVPAEPPDACLQEIRRGLAHLGLFEAAERGRPFLEEERDALVVQDGECKQELIAKLNPAELRRLAACCGDSLELSLRLVNVVTVTPDLSDEALNRLKRDALLGTYGLARMQLTLDKRTLLSSLGIQGADTDFYLFFTQEAAAAHLTKPLPDLEAEGGLFAAKEGDTKTVILVIEGDARLDGPCFAVRGGRFLADWKATVPKSPPSRAPSRRLHERAVAARTTLNWLGFRLDHLTPLDLHAHGRDEEAGGAVAEAVCRTRLALALAYTANQTKRIPRDDEKEQAEEWHCSFYSERFLAEIRLGARPPGLSAARFLSAVEDLSGLAEWVYDQEEGDPEHPKNVFVPDRLLGLRAVVAQALHGDTVDQAWVRLLESAGRIVQDTQQSWRSFIEGKMDEYFGRVKQLEDLVASSVEACQEKIHSLVKGLLESMLATVGFVIASLIGSFFSGSFDPKVFSLGVILYAGYLALFPGLLNLASATEEIHGILRMFRKRLRSFKSYISMEAIVRATGRGRVIKQEIARFKAWRLRARVAIYTSSVLLILAALLVPRLW